MESARVDVELTTDDRDILDASMFSIACRCCRSSTPVGIDGVGVKSLAVIGEMIFAAVMRYCERGVLNAALTGVCGTSLAEGTESTFENAVRGDGES